MSEESKVVFLDDEEGVVSEINLSLLIGVVRMMDKAGVGEKVDEFLRVRDQKIILPIEFANMVKRFILDNNLQNSDRLAQIVLLSAHCPCRGKTGPV